MLRTTSLACQAARTWPWDHGVEQSEELGPSLLGEALVGPGEQTPAPIQRIILVTAMAEGLVLHPPPALIQLGVGQLHEMKRIRDLHCVGQHRVEHRPVGTERSRVAQAMPFSHFSPRAANHRQGSAALRPATTSSRRPVPTSTMEVDQHWLRHCPWRQNSVSSRPRALVWVYNRMCRSAYDPICRSMYSLTCRSAPAGSTN
jgi:hypothetical protein